MSQSKSPGSASPFNWRSAPASLITDADRKNARIQQRLDARSAKRVSAHDGNLFASAAPAQVKIKPR